MCGASASFEDAGKPEPECDARRSKPGTPGVLPLVTSRADLKLDAAAVGDAAPPVVVKKLLV